MGCLRNRGRPSRVGQRVLRLSRPATGGALEVLDAPLGPGLTALARMDRLGRRTGPVAASGDRLLVLLRPGTSEEVPDVLRWLGWSHLDGLLKGRLLDRTGEPDETQAPDDAPGTWADLPQLIDAFAHACASALLDGSLSRAPSRTPHGGGSAPGRGR